MKKHNLHTHTRYSDGKLSPEELVDKAEQAGLEVLGICDHAFSSKLSSTYQVTDRLDQYLNHLRKLKGQLRSTQIMMGIEIDVSEFCGIDPQELPFSMLNKFDYVLFEYVNTEKEYWGEVGCRDISELIAVRSKLKIPIGLAHNDLQKNFKNKEEELAQLLANNDIFVELNQSEHHPSRGVGRNTRNRKDYYMHFSQELLNYLTKYDVKFVVGTDCHSGAGLADIDDVLQFIEKNKLKCHPCVL